MGAYMDPYMDRTWTDCSHDPPSPRPGRQIAWDRLAPIEQAGPARRLHVRNSIARGASRGWNARSSSGTRTATPLDLHLLHCNPSPSFASVFLEQTNKPGGRVG